MRSVAARPDAATSMRPTPRMRQESRSKTCCAPMAMWRWRTLSTRPAQTQLSGGACNGCWTKTMDSPTRNFLGLVGTSAALAAYPVCGFLAYVLIPLLGLSPDALARLGPVCLLPAIALTVLVGASAGLAARTLGRHMSAS